MAIEFGSRRETFENYKVYETMLAGRPFKVEMGKMWCDARRLDAFDQLFRFYPFLRIIITAALSPRN